MAKQVPINFTRENTTTFEQFTCYVDKHRKYKMTKTPGKQWSAFEYENKEWHPLNISGLDAQYMRDRIVKYHQDKTGEVRFEGSAPQKPMFKTVNGRDVFDPDATNNWLVGNMTPLAVLMPR
jgi:hypothetical protein